MKSNGLNVFFFTFLVTAAINCYADDFLLGVNAHILHDSEENITKTINMSVDVGIQSLRLDMPWSEVEQKKGQYQIPAKWDYAVDEMIKNDMKPLVILEYGNKNYNNGDKPTDNESRIAFSNYVNFLTAHFKNKVNYYEVWNEWDSSLGGTSPGNNADYQKLVRSVYPIIKKNNPNSTVITSAFSSAAFDKHLGIGNDDSMRTYLDSGIEDYTDAFAIHPYTTYKPKPHNKYETYVNDLKYSVSLVAQNKKLNGKPLYITEIGWSTVAGEKDGVTPQVQCQNIIQAIRDAKAHGIKALYIYDFKDDGIVRSTGVHFGLLNYDWSPKQSYLCLKKEFEVNRNELK
ncbi:cellulase family glycosylhydrolase [Klebsiella quasipneumoniae]|uniref:cellulase family glycosylhydrolase n=1 Tax=Klebsiella quasipneumoniae TaxID=1463165 RepID=UPI00115734E1|nr:cellulase family glycosylhydrolase [Klebsiella quasipneumoniae]